MCQNRVHHKINEKDKLRTRVTVGGNKIKYDRDAGAPADLLETSKLLFNSVLFTYNAKLMTTDIANFYLMMPMDAYEFLRRHTRDITLEIIEEHNLNRIMRNG